MRTGSATARTTGRRTWLFCAAWLSIWPRWNPQKRRSRVSSSAPDGITPTWSPSSPKPQKAKCDSPGLGGFFDGIVLHQVLQWHHMLSTWYPIDTIENLRLNTLWDGLFHSLTYVFVAVRPLVLWPTAPPPRLRSPNKLLVGPPLSALPPV